MLLDINDKLLDAYAPTAVGTTYQKYIDSLAQQEEGAGEPLYVYGKVSTTAVGAGATVTFSVIGNPTDPTFTTGNETLIQGLAIPVATLVAGYRFLAAPIPRLPIQGGQTLNPNLYRYISMSVTIATAALTGGVFDCWVSYKPIQDVITYPKNYTV